MQPFFPFPPQSIHALSSLDMYFFHCFTFIWCFYPEKINIRHEDRKSKRRDSCTWSATTLALNICSRNRCVFSIKNHLTEDVSTFFSPDIGGVRVPPFLRLGLDWYWKSNSTNWISCRPLASGGIAPQFEPSSCCAAGCLSSLQVVPSEQIIIGS